MASTGPKLAAGLIVYRRMSMEIEFLLLRTSYGKHHWTPPKGHVDPGETEFAAAVRETKEEAGLTQDQYKVVEGFKETLQYHVGGGPHGPGLKTVIYWLAELSDPLTPVILSDEHVEWHWGNLAQTKELSGFADMNLCYDNAHKFIGKI